MNSESAQNLECLTKFFCDSNEGFLVIDNEKNILWTNSYSKKLLGNIDNIKKVEFQFSFDICILNEDEIITYNPISAALKSDENFKTEALFQYEQNKYKNLLIRSFNLDDNKLLLLHDFTEEIENFLLKENEKALREIIQNTEEVKREYSSAEAQAIRSALINRISMSIRDTLDINEIIKTTIEETSKTLGVRRGLYASYDKVSQSFLIEYEWHANNAGSYGNDYLISNNDHHILELLASHTSQISTNIDSPDIEKEINPKPRLITPVIYRGNFLGMMLFYLTNKSRQWHQEEVTLVEGIAAQLATAINQANLFKKLEEQKLELEHALKQLKETQAQLVQSAKMAALGQLVAGVAHEINTPLAAINSNNDMIAKCIDKIKRIGCHTELDSASQEIPEQVRDNINSTFAAIENISKVNEEATNRINHIVKTLKNFARLDEAELKEIDIHEGIKSTLMLINHETKNRIQVIEEYGDLPLIKCYPNILNQVFMNLLVNAYQSIDKEGTIKIQTERHDDIVKIVISDTGKGIPPENLDKIFDPGFTTKGVGVGTGLGLSICYQIIQKHDGKINVTSQLGEGTTFSIEMPI